MYPKVDLVAGKSSKSLHRQQNNKILTHRKLTPTAQYWTVTADNNKTKQEQQKHKRDKQTSAPSKDMKKDKSTINI